MQLEVKPGDWGSIALNDLRLLLQSVFSSFYPPMTEDDGLTVCIEPSAVKHPWTRCRKPNSEQYHVYLSAKDLKWSKFAYQFAHELCHVLSDCERLQTSKNRWFHEVLCEAASIYTLKSMSNRWKLTPPRQEWSFYAPMLREYSEDEIYPHSKEVARDAKLRDWLEYLEDILRMDCEIREVNAVFAHSLLPLFESRTANWRVIQSLPATSSCFQTYLQEWHAAAHPRDRHFVQKIVDAFA